MRAVVLALALTRAAAQTLAGMATLAPTPLSEFSCAFMDVAEDSLMYQEESTQEMVHAWGGFPQCKLSVGFCAAALVPNALVASLFALISQVAGVVCYFVGAWREKSNGAMAATSVWNKSVTIVFLKVAEFSVVQASLEKVFIRIVSGEGGEHEARDAHNRSVQVAQDLGDDSDDDLDNFQFRERTCCKCSYFAHGLLCKYHSTCCCAMCCYMFMSIFGASWFVWFNTCTLTLLFHMFAAVTNCVGRCCLQEPKVED